jgi:hypothetical protein
MSNEVQRKFNSYGDRMNHRGRWRSPPLHPPAYKGGAMRGGVRASSHLYPQTRQISAVKYFRNLHLKFFRRLVQHGNIATYERSVPRRSSCSGGSSRITHHHVGPFGWKSEDHPNTQFGDDGAPHGVLAQGEKLESRHAGRRASRF